MVKLTAKTKRLIDAKNIAALATVMPDGSPRVTRIWIDHEDDIILINAAEGRLKQKNLISKRRVALAVCDFANPHTALVIRGKVLGNTKEGALERIEKMSMKYLGKKYPRKHGERQIFVKISTCPRDRTLEFSRVVSR